MKLTATQIRYLLAIYRLSKNGVVRSSEIADCLNVSRPSAHRMVEQLLKMNLIVKEKHSHILFTENSRDFAEQYYDGLFHISRFLLKSLDLSPDIAEDGALAILSELNTAMIKELCTQISDS